MRIFHFLTVFSVLLSLLSGCATKETGSTYYVNEMGEINTSMELSSELRLVAEAMTHAMLPTLQSGKNMRHPPAWPNRGKPLAVIVEVDNRTGEFVDSRQVTDAIRAALRAHGAVLALDDELPLSDAARFVPPPEETPEDDLLTLHLPRQGPSLPLAVPDKEEPSLTQRLKSAPLQPAPVRTSELLSPKRTPSSGKKRQDASADARFFSILLPESDVPLPPHETDGPAPVRMSILTFSPDETKPFESRAQKRERILRLLETRLKEQREGTRDYAPIYAIKTVLLPFAPPAGSDGADANLKVVYGEKQPYMFKMFVEDIQSETIKWASAWEVQKKIPSVANITNGGTENSYRAPVAPESGQEEARQDGSTLSDNIRDIRNVTDTVQDIRTIRESLQK
ncbi:MAG: hypothetical protein LBC37_04885 [Zoogloeaceae bacterium]|jgi:hypothetical protein|nr:hypothetical protein [Zoogloeaceae bacterium]